MVARTTLTPDTQLVLAYIREQGSVTPKQLRDAFRAQANSAGYGVASWLQHRLESLAARRHVTGDVDTRGRIERWHIAPGEPAVAPVPVPAPAPAPVRAADDQAKPAPQMYQHCGYSIAQPRRLSAFEGGTYTPAPVAMRPGAMDYAAVPSLQMGQRRAFRSGRS